MRYRMALLLCLVATVGCGHKLPPAQRLMEPGPGVGGPGPGVMPPFAAPPMGCVGGDPSQVHFVGPEGMHIQWDESESGSFDSQVLVAPGRYNFGQGSVYRLRLSQIPGYEEQVLYPTIEVAPGMPRTLAYLAHNAIPVQFTQEDFDQVLTGNFVTKVIYLPDAEFQELAIAGVETLVSTRLDPGVDPIIEADRRGTILAIIRLGNKYLEQVGGDEYGGSGFGGSCAEAGMGMGAGMYAANGYGMPITGTPIGLPGPPHIPLGVPAGLQKHVIKNHTYTHLPHPTKHVKVNVKQTPGYSYPKPANHISIHERAGFGHMHGGGVAAPCGPECGH